MRGSSTSRSARPSTRRPQGNIGPVTEALIDALGAPFAFACPAFPENGRTVFRGHLFVGDQLLSDTGMRHHPLTPMADANLVRVLQAQAQRRVGLLRHDTIARGAAAVRARIEVLIAEGRELAIADAVADDDLRTLARAAVDQLITAGSGVALGLPAVYAERGWLVPDADAAQLDAVGGHAPCCPARVRPRRMRRSRSGSTTAARRCASTRRRSPPACRSR